MWSVVMLNVVMLNVVMLNVVEPENLAPDYQNFFLSFMASILKLFTLIVFAMG